jgi:hypothetical protein
MKKAIVLAAVLSAGVPAFAFQLGMGAREVGTEVSSRYSKGESLEIIAGAAKSVNIAAAILAPELLLTGNASDKVLAAMIKAGYYPSELVNTLVSLGGDRAALNQVAIANGADPTSLLAATAAGAPGAGNLGNGAGFNGNSFSNSRAATIGGGGTIAVSHS